jgi:uncharacterized damage-inducible protein DinB
MMLFPESPDLFSGDSPLSIHNSYLTSEETMISADLIARYFGLNHRVLHMQIDGLSHEDSLLQPPFRGNNLNWVLGHIIASRSTALATLGGEPVWTKEEAAPYAQESEPVTAAGAYPLKRLVADLDTAQERLEVAELAHVPEGKDRSLGERLSFLYWHEAYHTGQTELLRQLAGTDDKII